MILGIIVAARLWLTIDAVDMWNWKIHHFQHRYRDAWAWALLLTIERRQQHHSCRKKVKYENSLVVKANKLTNLPEDRFERKLVLLQVMLAKLKLKTPGIQTNFNPFGTNVWLMYLLKKEGFLMFWWGMEVKHRLNMS